MMKVLAFILLLVIMCSPAFANQVLRDKYGLRLGEIKTENNREVIYDKYGNRLGYFDGKYTYDKYGNRIGEGNLLTTLLR